MLIPFLARRAAQIASLGILVATTSTFGQACTCPGDLDLDGVVGGADLGQLLSAWGSSLATADLDGNGVVNGADLGLLLGAWGPCPDVSNDHCAGALSIGLGSHAFCTTYATTDGPAPAPNACESASQIHNDVWFRYQALSTGQLTVSTCSAASFDTVIAIYGSTIPGTWQCPTGGVGTTTFVGCSDDFPGCSGLTSKLTINVVAGNIYLIRVGGFSAGLKGSGTLTLSLNQPGESCANPHQAVAGATFQTVWGDTRDNATAPIPPGCFNGTTPGPSEWIRWTATCNGAVIVSTCNPGTDFDTVLTVLRYEFDGNCWSTFVNCNDDSFQSGCTLNGVNHKSYLQFNVTAGEELYFVVSGYQGAAGPFQLTSPRRCN
ncbi:MAG: hypothetical protein JNK53_03735 [Phycisphaerae bacterium]|nr:hypothetical protein [Phycisphaerae bacterium]